MSDWGSTRWPTAALINISTSTMALRTRMWCARTHQSPLGPSQSILARCCSNKQLISPAIRHNRGLFSHEKGSSRKYFPSTKRITAELTAIHWWEEKELLMITLDGEGNLWVNVGFCLARYTAPILLCQKSATLDYFIQKSNKTNRYAIELFCI